MLRNPNDVSYLYPVGTELSNSDVRLNWYSSDNKDRSIEEIQMILSYTMEEH